MPDSHSDAEAAYLLGIFGDATELLDVPSGDGRIALRLAEPHRRVTAVDLSTVAIERLEQLAHPNVCAIRADMAHLDGLAADVRFDGAYCLGNSFGYLDDTATASFLSAVAARLRPGASFVIDHAVAAELVLRDWQSRPVTDEHTVGDLSLRVTNRFDIAEADFIAQMRLQNGNHVEMREAHHRVRTIGHAISMLRTAGFELVALHGGTDAQPFDSTSHGVYIVARKRLE